MNWLYSHLNVLTIGQGYRLVHTEVRQRQRKKIFFVVTKRLPLTLPLLSLNGSTTHLVTTLLPSPSPCEHFYLFALDPFISNDIVAVTVTQCERALCREMLRSVLVCHLLTVLY